MMMTISLVQGCMLLHLDLLYGKKVLSQLKFLVVATEISYYQRNHNSDILLIFFHRGEEIWCLCAIFGSMVEAQVLGGKALIPTMKAFVKMHVVYVMILAFCGLRIRKHYFEQWI